MTFCEQKDLFPMPKEFTRKPLVLKIRGLIPSFKNNKILIAKTRTGQPLPRPLLITKPEYQERMEKIVDNFVSQLLCAFQTEGGETLTGCSLRSAIASSMPEDDCWTQLTEITIRAELCNPGEEGATLILERLEPKRKR